MSKLALLGPKFIVGPLSAAGVEVFPCDSTRQSRETLAKLTAQQEHAIIFMIERYARELVEDIETAEEKGLNVLLLPDHRGSIGLFKEMLENLIKKATGASNLPVSK